MCGAGTAGVFCLHGAAQSEQQSCLIPSAAGNPDEWERMFKVNVLAPMRLVRQLAPKMCDKVGAAAALQSLFKAGMTGVERARQRPWPSQPLPCCSYHSRQW